MENEAHLWKEQLKSAQVALDAVVVSFGLLLLACLSWCYMSLSSSPVQRGSFVSFAKVSVRQGRAKPETKQLAVVCEKADFYFQNCYQGKWYMHSNSWCYVSLCMYSFQTQKIF